MYIHIYIYIYIYIYSYAECDGHDVAVAALVDLEEFTGLAETRLAQNTLDYYSD